MTAMQSVAAAFDSVAAWRDEQQSQQKSQLVEVESQLEALKAERAALDEKISSLETFHAEIAARDVVGDREASQFYDAIFASLETQAVALAERAAEVTAVREAREAQVIATLPSTDLAPLVEEYNQFKTQVEPTLKALPESYRGAIIEHHNGVCARIRDYLDDALSAPATSDGERLELDFVYGVDPELLVCVLPIAEDVLENWSERDDDIATLASASVVQAIYEAAKQSGLNAAHVGCGGHRGLLAIELDLEGATGEFGKSLVDSFNAVLKASPELAAAKLGLSAVEVSLDYLLPADIEEEEA